MFVSNNLTHKYTKNAVRFLTAFGLKLQIIHISNRNKIALKNYDIISYQLPKTTAGK